MQDGTSPDKAVVHVAVDAELAETAARRGLDVGKAVERGLRREIELAEVERLDAETWRAENAAAIAAWNAEAERDGIWSDGLRSF